MKASECKCVMCGKPAVAFWPVIDPDIPAEPYCRKCLDKIKADTIRTLFGDVLDKHKELGTKTCRTCKHRERWALSDWSSKVVQCCNLQPSKRSNSGYKTIKAKNKACENYESILL